MRLWAPRAVSEMMNFYSNAWTWRMTTGFQTDDGLVELQRTQRIITNFESDDRPWEQWWTLKTASLVLVKPTPAQSMSRHDPVLVHRRGTDLMVWNPVRFGLSQVLFMHFILMCTVATVSALGWYEGYILIVCGLWLSNACSKDERHSGVLCTALLFIHSSLKFTLCRPKVEAKAVRQGNPVMVG